MINQLNLNRFKRNLQEIMLNNLAITMQSFDRKFWKLVELLIAEVLVVKTAISSITILA